MQVYQEFLKQLRPLLVSRENNVMLEFSFWQTSPPMVTDGIYELRKYSLKVNLQNDGVLFQSHTHLYPLSYFYRHIT